jgi:hypothetical protein
MHANVYTGGVDPDIRFSVDFYPLTNNKSGWKSYKKFSSIGGVPHEVGGGGLATLR